MPLSNPSPRKPMHTRTVECRGYLRDDGLWDIEGHMIDSKPFEIPNEDRGGEIPAGEPLHEMWIRLTVDTDLVVHDVEACTDHAPYSVCGNIVASFEALRGLAIKAGWALKTRELLGGTRGCTHLVELLGPIATTAFQTVYPARIKREKEQPPTRRPGLINSCHAYAADGPIVKRRWPQFFTGAD
jgi:hypothetical protein